MTTLPRSVGHHVRTRGGPLVVLVALLGGWCAVRVMWWEDPFASAARAEPAGVPPAPTAIAAAMAPFSRYVPVPDMSYGWVAPGGAQRPGGQRGVWQPATMRYARGQPAAPQPATIWLPGEPAGYALPPGSERDSAQAMDGDAPAASPLSRRGAGRWTAGRSGGRDRTPRRSLRGAFRSMGRASPARCCNSAWRPPVVMTRGSTCGPIRRLC